MKHVRMLGLVVAMAVPMTVGCRSDDDPTKDPSSQATGGAGGRLATGGSSSIDNAGGNSNATTDSGAQDATPEIAGNYVDDYGSTHQITKSTWVVDTSIFHIAKLDNAQKFLIASNDSNNEWNANLWSRFDWTRNSNGDLYYCQTTYKSASEQEAEMTQRADASDLTKGCGALGFGWTKLTPEAPDAGS